MPLCRSLALLVTLLICSCTPVQKGPQPTVALIKVEVGEVSLFETGAKFTLRLDNPAPADLVANGAAHDITVNEIQVGRALDKGRFVVPRLGSIKREVVIHLQDLMTLTKLKSMMENPRLDYRIESTLYTDGGSFGKGELVIRQEAVLNLENLGQAPKSHPSGRRFDPDEFRLVDPEEPEEQPQ